MTDRFFITRADMQALASRLREIPELVEDLAITLTRQARLGGGGGKLHSRRDAQPLPFDLNASDVADDLHGTIFGWVRHTCESRGIAYAGGTSTVAGASWLADHVTSLAMTEGCEEALDEVMHAMGRARRACDCVPERTSPPRTDVEVAAAHARAPRLRVSPAQAERLMPTLGHPAVKAATIRKWHERGKVHPDENGLYLMGDLIELNPKRRTDATVTRREVG